MNTLPYDYFVNVEVAFALLQLEDALEEEYSNDYLPF